MITKEKIIEIVNACVQYNANQGTWSIDNRFADELLALIEQDKKAQAKEIFDKVLNYGEIAFGDHTIGLQQIGDCVEKLAKEYEVEL